MSKKLVTFQIEEDTYAKFGAVVSAKNGRKGSTISDLITNYVKSNETAVNELKISQKILITSPEIYADLTKWTRYIVNLETMDILTLENRVTAILEILERIRNNRYNGFQLRNENPYVISDDAIFVDNKRKK